MIFYNCSVCTVALNGQNMIYCRLKLGRSQERERERERERESAEKKDIFF